MFVRVMSRRDESEVHFLRLLAGYRKIDRKRNTNIREELEIFELNNGIKENINH